MITDELKKEARKDADSVSRFDLQTSVMVAKDKNHAYRLGRYDGYLSGAEPREKHIEELIALINAERERQENCDNVHLRTIADLEKENAELKVFRQDCVKLTEDNVVMARQRAEMARQLTKAIELLNEFMRISKASDEDFEHDYSDLIAEAENFLNSEVEK